MLAVWQMAFSLIQACLALYGAFYIFSAVWWPRFFLDNLSVHWQHSGNFMLYAKIICTWAGLGIFAFCGAGAIVEVIPSDWGGVDQDGIYTSTRVSIQCMVAFWAIALSGKLGENAVVILREPYEKQAKQSLLWALYERTRPAYLTSEQTESLMIEAKQRYAEKVKTGWENRSEWDQDIREDVFSSISLDRREVDRW